MRCIQAVSGVAAQSKNFYPCCLGNDGASKTLTWTKGQWNGFHVVSGSSLPTWPWAGPIFPGRGKDEENGKKFGETEDREGKDQRGMKAGI